MNNNKTLVAPFILRVI